MCLFLTRGTSKRVTFGRLFSKETVGCPLYSPWLYILTTLWYTNCTTITSNRDSDNIAYHQKIDWRRHGRCDLIKKTRPWFKSMEDLPLRTVTIISNGFESFTIWVDVLVMLDITVIIYHKNTSTRPILLSHMYVISYSSPKSKWRRSCLVILLYNFLALYSKTYSWPNYQEKRLAFGKHTGLYEAVLTGVTIAIFFHP